MNWDVLPFARPSVVSATVFCEFQSVALLFSQCVLGAGLTPACTPTFMTVSTVNAPSVLHSRLRLTSVLPHSSPSSFRTPRSSQVRKAKSLITTQVASAGGRIPALARECAAWPPPRLRFPPSMLTPFQNGLSRRTCVPCLARSRPSPTQILAFADIPLSFQDSLLTSPPSNGSPCVSSCHSGKEGGRHARSRLLCCRMRLRHSARPVLS